MILVQFKPRIPPLYSMNSTQQLTWYITNSIPCMFLKYGDGEYNAANFYEGGNCDGTPYTKNLGEKVRESFVYNSRQPNAMIGAWHDTSNRAFWESLGNSVVNWVDYHTVIIDNTKNIHESTDKLELFKSIRQTTRKKIYVANAGMYKAKQIFSIDSFVDVDPSDWFDTEYEEVFNSVCEEVEDDANTLIMTSAGMGAKYLVSQLHRLYPRAIYIDIGSAFDAICTKKRTRDCSPSYEDLCEYLRPMMNE
jgi:hypothetical protein